MTSLPSVDKCGLDATGLRIWPKLLEAEAAALKNVTRTQSKYKDQLIGIRILGFFLKDFWDHSHDGYLGSTPYTRMVLEITSCLSYPDDGAIYKALGDLGLMYRNYLLRVFRSNAGVRPTPSQHASRPSFEVIKSEILKELGEVSQTKQHAKKQALLRDGYKCALSNDYDFQSCIKITEIGAACKASGKKPTQTQVAHIFSESAQEGDKDYPSTVFAILEMFGLKQKAQALYGGEVNGLHNVITMAVDLHMAFDTFNLWLEPVPNQENTYDLCGRIFEFPTSLPRRITFRVDPSASAAATAVNKTLKLPDPTLIAVRAACARVANLSGAAEQIDQILRDLEDITVLADDGSMAELLYSRLLTSTSSTVNVHG